MRIAVISVATTVAVMLLLAVFSSQVFGWPFAHREAQVVREQIVPQPIQVSCASPAPAARARPAAPARRLAAPEPVVAIDEFSGPGWSVERVYSGPNPHCTYYAPASSTLDQRRRFWQRECRDRGFPDGFFEERR